jgi:hypothetical protein
MKRYFNDDVFHNDPAYFGYVEPFWNLRFKLVQSLLLSIFQSCCNATSCVSCKVANTRLSLNKLEGEVSDFKVPVPAWSLTDSNDEFELENN